MEKEDYILAGLLEQCKRIWESIKMQTADRNPSLFGKLPDTAIIKFCEGEDSKLPYDINHMAVHTWKLAEGHITEVENSVSHQCQPVSGMFYPEAAFWIRYHLENETAYIIYQFGPRYGRCIQYDMIVHAHSIDLRNEQVIWVS